MMTEYFPIQPLGDRTQEIEVFGSLFSRMAWAHRVTIHVFITHIHHWWTSDHPTKPSFRSGLLATRSPMLCSIGPNVDALVRAVGAGTGDQSLCRTTFLPIKLAISSQGRGLSRYGRAWCPACMRQSIDAGEQFYDRLAWSTMLINRCIDHKLMLETNCPRCGAVQERYHKSGQLDICWRCSDSLRSKPESWRVSSRAKPLESECMSIIRAIADGSLRRVGADTYRIFLSELWERFSSEKKSIWRSGKFPDRETKTKLTVQPLFSKFLKSCCAYGVDPVNVLTDPIGAAKSASLLEFAHISLPPNPRPVRPKGFLATARKLLERELAKVEGADMLPLRAIAKEAGVSLGFFNYHFEKMVVEYSSRRRSALNRRNELHLRLATDILKAELLPLYVSRTITNIDYVASTLSRRAGVSINLSRRVIKAALEEFKLSSQLPIVRDYFLGA